jgi:hypothetical protein
MNWETLSGLLARNSQKQFQVNVLEVRKAATDVEFFPIRAPSVPTPPAPLPAPPTPPTPAPPPSPPPERQAPVAEKPVIVLEVKEPVSAKYVVDPIVVGIEHTDPLYIGAPERTQRAIECECAQAIEARLDELYKSEAGRSRGWTKVGLDAMIKPRCASGGDLGELDRAKKGFVWSAVLEDKGASAFLDFVCVAKGIRVAVWFNEKKQVVVFPAADATAAVAPRDESEAAVATKAFDQIYHVDSAGHPRFGMRSPAALLEFCAREFWTVLPPHSVLHSLSGLTLSELESVATQLGLAADALPRSKADRVTAIASHKLKLRLHG